MLALSHCQRTWHSCAQQSSNILFIKYSLGFYLSGFVLDANGSSARSKTGLLSLELAQSTARVSQLSLQWAGSKRFTLQAGRSLMRSGKCKTHCKRYVEEEAQLYLPGQVWIPAAVFWLLLQLRRPIAGQTVKQHWVEYQAGLDSEEGCLEKMKCNLRHNRWAEVSCDQMAESTLEKWQIVWSSTKINKSLWVWECKTDRQK